MVYYVVFALMMNVNVAPIVVAVTMTESQCHATAKAMAAADIGMKDPKAIERGAAYLCLKPITED